MPAGGRRKRTPRPSARRSSSRRRSPGRRLRSTVPPVRSRTGSATCWRDWTARAAARLVVSPNAVEGLRPLLPELAARAGFAGSLELESDPRLPEGAAQLLWPGGWLEHDPATVAARVAELLAAHDPHPSPARHGWNRP